MTLPYLSIVIPTHNRRELLALALDSLRSVEGLPGKMEVVVVDDGSTDRTPEMLAARRDAFALRVIRHPLPLGPAAARNAGARAAQGEILGFLDSDVTVGPEWWKWVKPHFQDPRVAGVEGATCPPPGSPLPTPFTRVVSNTRGKNYLTCNIFYRKEIFIRLGGFDERFLRANREDSDFAFTVLEQGFAILFEPRACAWHPLVAASPRVYWQETRYGLHEPLLRRKHPDAYRRYLKWIDGRAFPVFYWGVFLGLPLGILGGLGFNLPLSGLGGVLFGLGLAGSVYAVCRKRRVSLRDLAILIPQFFIIPWLRLFWVLRGEWRYRKVGKRK